MSGDSNFRVVLALDSMVSADEPTGRKEAK
jgi:hypothetical protein